MDAVTNDHKLGGFREQKCILPQLWELEVHIKVSAEHIPTEDSEEESFLASPSLGWLSEIPVPLDLQLHHSNLLPSAQEQAELYGPLSSVPRVPWCSCKLPSPLIVTGLKAPGVCSGLSAFWDRQDRNQSPCRSSKCLHNGPTFQSPLSLLRKALGAGFSPCMYNTAFNQGLWQLNATFFPTSFNMMAVLLTWGVGAQ